MALRRLPDDAPRRIDLGPVRLYLDEIEELCEILGDDGMGVRIEADGMEADKVADLTRLPNTRIRTLSLTRVMMGPAVTVEITRTTQRVSILNLGIESRGIAHGAADVLRRHRRRVTGRLSIKATFSLMTALVATNAVLVVLSVYRAPDSALGSLAWLMPAVLASGATIGTYYLTRSVVVARRRADSPGFFRRTGDQIAVAAVSSALSALLGGVVGFLLGRL